MPNEISITTLNVGRLLQPRTRAYLERLALDEEPRPDVLCLQDMPFRDLRLFEWAPHVSFVPMTNHLINGERAVVGVAIVSRYFMCDVAHRTTWGNGLLKDLQGVDDRNQRIAPTAENDRLIEASEDRVAICATVLKGGVKYNIATTHGFWVRSGVPNDQQRMSTSRLLDFLSRQGQERGCVLLAGDMNFGWGSELYKKVTGQYVVKGLVDCMPRSIDNTLDPEHQFVKKGGKVVTDWFFAQNWRDRTCVVADVRLRSGVSDHCALSATVSIT